MAICDCRRLCGDCLWAGCSDSVESLLVAPASYWTDFWHLTHQKKAKKCISHNRNFNYAFNSALLKPPHLQKTCPRRPGSYVPAPDYWFSSFQLNICLVVFPEGQPIAFLSARPLWLYNLPLTPLLGNSDDNFKVTVSWTRPSIPRGPRTPKQSAASLSNHGSSYCCWQLTPVPSAGGIRWEWVRRSTGANRRRPRRVPYPNGELLEVADGKKIGREKHEGR